MSLGNIILWHNIFALVDDGKVSVSEYRTLKERVLKQASRHPDGVGGLVIIPENATPPPQDARDAINAALHEFAGSLRCLSWVVEGSGFQAAMVRSVLSGIRMIRRPPYPTFVTRNLDEALGCMFPLLGGGLEAADLPLALRQIWRERGLCDLREHVAHE